MLIAGGGFAALEAALAVRALAGDRFELGLVSAQPQFAYRPAATVEAFEAHPPRSYDLNEIAADLGATFYRAKIEAVTSRQRWVRLGSGARLDYDALILAIGARARAALPGAMVFRDQRDTKHTRVLLDQVAAGSVKRLVFAVPSHHAWSLPIYELALLSAAHAARHRVDTQITVVTPEPAPLALFGSHASRRVAGLLAERAIRFIGGSLPHSVGRDGALRLQFDAPVKADRVVAVPDLHGPRIIGVPAGWYGFVPTDRVGRVEGLADVYAAGDMTTFPVKQGGIAAQQADRIAHTLAASLGAEVKELRQDPMVLRARLLDGEGALVLRTELDELGRPAGGASEHREARRAEDLKVFGRYLTPYLAMYNSCHPVAA